MRIILISTLILGCILSGAQASTRYITDEFEVTMRSGTSTANSIVRLLRSGEAVTVLEEDLASQYSLVETGDNKKGYVLSRFLMTEPAARQQLQELQQQYEQQQNRLQEQVAESKRLGETLEQAQSDNAALKQALRASEQELEAVRSAARDTLNILEQNKQLQTVVAQLQQDKALLSDENAALRDTTQIDWFVRGGAVSLIAFLIGIVVTRIRWRKQDSWGSY